MTNIRLGRRVLKDPSGLDREITSYEKFLDKKFQGVKADLLRAADSPADINDTVDEALDKVQDEAAMRITANVRASQLAGIIRTDQFLLAAGVVFEPDKNARLDVQATQILEQRNLAALKGITDEVGKVIKSELTAGILAGESSRDLAKRIVTAVDDIGIHRARTMARTETLFAFNTAAKANYARRGVSEVEWLTAPNDGRLCDACAPLNGKTYPIGQAPDIPAHPRCRCVLLPVISEVPA